MSAQQHRRVQMSNYKTPTFIGINQQLFNDLTDHFEVKIDCEDNPAPQGEVVEVLQISYVVMIKI